MPEHPRGITGASPPAWSDLPPGQQTTSDFPVISTELPPRVRNEEWTFTLINETSQQWRWNWTAFRALPAERFTVDLHSVLGWSKVATNWEGVPLGALFGGVNTTAEFAHVYTYGDYTTNLPLEDLLEMPTWIAFGYEGRPIPVEHGGPARLVVPHLYFWKSAKWVRGITLSDRDEPGTRERGGLHNYGDPWREQRHRDD